MTSYHGGKQLIGNRIAKKIYEKSIKVEENYYFTIKGYCEPFCGMLGVYQHIPTLFSKHSPKIKYKAGDLNASVIAMWKAVQKGWKPPSSSSEKEFNRLKNSKNPSKEKGYIGHQYSFGGQFFKGYAPKYGKTSNSEKARQRVIDIGKNLKNVSFTGGNYTRFSNLRGYVIYCDPPYSGAWQKYDEKFDTKKFWEWCEDMAVHNIVFISEYSAPVRKGFNKVLSIPHKLTGISPSKKGKRKKKNERRDDKLFMIF